MSHKTKTFLGKDKVFNVTQAMSMQCHCSIGGGVVGGSSGDG
jgi:hypothetical protein